MLVQRRRESNERPIAPLVGASVQFEHSTDDLDSRIGRDNRVQVFNLVHLCVGSSGSQSSPEWSGAWVDF
jgi:hypothetical protein